MNEELHKKKHSPYFNAVLAVLGVAFLVTSFDNPLKLFEPPLLSVGSKDIKAHEFRVLLAHSYTLTDFSNIENQNMAVLSYIINNELVSLEAERMGIKTSEAAAQESLKKRPLFLDEQGTFQQERLQKFLSASGLTLAQLIKQEQRVLSRNRLKQALLDQIPHAPQALIKLTSIGAFQERTGIYKKFPIAASNKSITPPEKELKALFSEKQFQSPEYRSYRVLQLSPMALAHMTSSTPSPKEVSLAQAKFEKLCIQIEDDLGAGMSLEDIVASRGLSSLVKSMTTDAQGRSMASGKNLSKTGNDKKVAEIAFSLSPEENARPVSLSTGYFFVIKVDKIDPPKILTFQEAYPQLVQAWSTKNNIFEKQALEKAKLYEKTLSHSSPNELIRLSNKDPHVVWLPSQALQYNGANTTIPSVVKDSLSKMAPGQVSKAQDKENVYAIRLVSVTLPDYKKNAYRVTDLVKDTLTHALWDTFVAALAQKYPVHIHKNRLEGFFKKSY
jgi:hypothetical protein